MENASEMPEGDVDVVMTGPARTAEQIEQAADERMQQEEAKPPVKVLKVADERVVRVQRHSDGQEGAHDDEDDDDNEEEAPVVNKLADCVEFEKDVDELYYVGTSGIKVTHLNGLEDMPNLKRLHIRSNLLQSMEGLDGHIPVLEYLELYDNQIERIECLPTLTRLHVLDLSFNGIRVLPDLSSLTQLQELYVANNKLKAIAGISELRELRKLDLGANRLREITGLNHLARLEQLWLGKNKIGKIEGLEGLTSLKIISVQSNRLLTIDGLEHNTELEELYLSHNGIDEIEHIFHLSKLTTLDVGANRITNLPAEIAALTQLEDLWVNDNKVTQFEDVERLAPLPNLSTLYLERNPLAADYEYRLKLEAMLPALAQIDAVATTKARRR